MRAILLTSLACLLFGAVAWANDPRLEQPATGGRLYRAQCAPCHGMTGHGDGPEASLFSPPPPNLRIQSLQRHDADALVLRILGATEPIVPSARAIEASEARADAMTSYLERLPHVNWELANRGRASYMERCEGCHGAFGHPGPPASEGGMRPRDLTASIFPTGDAQLAVLLRHGREGMPPLAASVPDAEVRALVAFVRLLSPGYETYQTACAGCHGAEGIPSRGAGRPTVVFDRAYFAAHDTRALRSKVWHMLGEPKPGAMPHFQGVLTDAQAHAIVDYLQLLPAE